MKDNIPEIKEKLIQNLNRLVEKTETIYLNLGRDYPLLLQELDKSVQKSSSSADSLKEGGSLSSIDQIIGEGTQITDQFNNSFTSMYSRDGELFEIIERGISEMSSLSQVISNIKEISIEMELISLNAMTVALKSGTAGKAFSFITDELKKLSAQTIKLTDLLTVNGNSQLERFEAFRKMIEEARKRQDTLTENLEQHLKSSFSASSMALKESGEMMLSLSRSSQDVQPPLVRIMQEIQLQDIIRQSIDHIYISLDGFQEIRSDWSESEKLDELAFRKMMPDLCFSVLEDVNKEILESCSVFEEQSSQVRSMLDSLESRRTDFTKAAFETDSDDSFDILSLKSQSSERINNLIQDVNESVKRRLAISDEGIALLKEITILQRQFQSFEPIITRFHNIIVASRIEVAKQEALSDMKGTVTNMTELTEGMNDDINQALDTIKHFLKTTEKIISSYSANLRKEMPELKALLGRTGDNQKRLDGVTDTIIDGLRDFQIFTPRFFSLFNETDGNRGKLKELTANIETIKGFLQDIKDLSEKELSDLSSVEEAAGWTIQSERLNSIIEKFTIFTHKKTASDLAGTDVEAEEVVDSGEVTLF